MSATLTLTDVGTSLEARTTPLKGRGLRRSNSAPTANACTPRMISTGW